MVTILIMLEEQITYHFNNKELLRVATTRLAAVHENRATLPEQCFTYARLRFIGVRVLSLAISDLLFSTTLFKTEGGLTLAHARILSHNGLLVAAARKIKLDESLILGWGEQLNDIQLNDKVLFSHMQALFGAIWLDCNRDYATIIQVILHLFEFPSLNRSYISLIDLPVGCYPPSNFDAIQSKISYRFNNLNFLIHALLRQSALEESLVGATASFQTLEFLGDKIFGCIVADWLFENCSEDSDKLSPLLDQMVCNTNILSNVASALKLGDALILGNGESLMGLSNNRRRMADHLEAVIAAIWLDTSQRYPVTREILLKLFLPSLIQIFLPIARTAFNFTCYVDYPS
ncbi:MAG: ribonuclease III domain-containing protein [Gammaproteobacteria bacterium]